MDFFEQEAKEAEAFEAEMEAEANGETVETTEEPDETPQGDEAADPAPEGEGDTSAGLEESETKPESNGQQEAEDKTEDATEENAEPEAKEDQKTGKPPEGFVEIQALTETRSKMKTFRDRAEKAEAENQALLLEVQRLMSGANDKKSDEPEFKELSPEELADLKEEDPDAYHEYRADLIEHKDRQRHQQELEARKQHFDQLAMREVNEAGREIGEMLAAEGMNEALITYGAEAGFTQADLVALSHPDTKLVTGDGKTRYLGKGALAFLKHLDAGRTMNRETLKAEIEKELRPKIIEEETKRILGKIKNPEGQQKSLDGQGEKGVKPLPETMTEADFARMSPEDQERWLQQ